MIGELFETSHSSDNANVIAGQQSCDLIFNYIQIINHNINTCKILLCIDENPKYTFVKVKVMQNVTCMKLDCE